MKQSLKKRILQLAAGPDQVPVVVEWNDQSVPGCAEDNCPYYDGKRCRLLGFRPNSICEPAVGAMAELLEKAI